MKEFLISIISDRLNKHIFVRLDSIIISFLVKMMIIMTMRRFREYLFIKNLNIFESSWTSFLRPFNSWLWVAVLVATSLLAASLCLICHYSRRYGQEDPQTAALGSLSGSLFAIYTTLCHQGKKKKKGLKYCVLKNQYRKQTQGCTKDDLLVITAGCRFSRHYNTLKRPNISLSNPWRYQSKV